MNTNKQFTYKLWLDELKTTPSEVFFPTFGQYFDLLIRENPKKIEVLQNQVDEEKNKLSHYRNEAVKKLEELLERVKIEAEKENLQSLPEVDKYNQIKKGEVLTSESLPDTLYHAIRLTIEKYRNEGKFKKFDNLMGVNDNFWYLDYDKICKSYPNYKLFKDAEDAHNQEYKKEPWGAYRYLRFAVTFFVNVSSERAGSFVKPEIIDNLRRLILYLLTPESKERKVKPVKFTGIKGLFFLSRTPYEIYYEGSVKIEKAWIPVKGKTQPYAILQLATEKYKRKASMGGDISEQVRLSEVEIRECLSDPKRCDRHPNWKATILPKRRLKLLEKNIKSIVAFTDDELKVEEYNRTSYLVFHFNLHA